jgi:hypothetical protein
MEADAVVVDYDYEEDQIEEVEWVQIANHPDYDIQTEFPFQIRKRETGQLLSLRSRNSYGYTCVKLNRRTQNHHRIIAEQFLNCRPEDVVDHKNRIRTDNRLENLRITTMHENARNKESTKGVVFEYLDSIPSHAITIEHWGQFEFDNLYYLGDGRFAVFNGLQFRVLYHTLVKNTYYVRAYDRNGTQRNINVAKYRRMIDDLP